MYQDEAVRSNFGFRVFYVNWLVPELGIFYWLQVSEPEKHKELFIYILSFLLYTHATSAWVIKVTFKINNRVCQYIIVEWLTISGAREITKNLGLDIDITCDGSWHECSDSCSNSSGLSSTCLAIRVVWFLVLINISLRLRLPLSLYVLRQKQSKDTFLSHDSLRTS